MKKNTLLVLVLGLSLFITGKCLASSGSDIGSPASTKNPGGISLINGDPKLILPGSKGQNTLAPSNDNCATATPITSLPYFFSQNDGASATDDGLIATCGNDGMNDGMWYTVVGDGSNISITVTPTVWDFYVQIGVYTGTCGELVCAGTVDAAIENFPENFVITNSVVGTVYYINVGRNTDYTDISEGNFTIDVHTIVPSTNNDCTGATAITSLPYSHSQEDGTTATNSGVIAACPTAMNEGVWYTVVGDGGNIKVTVTASAGGSFDPVLGIFTGICGDFDCTGSINATGGGQVETYIIHESDPGVTYYINIGDYNNHMGNFVIDVSTIITPVNDACSGALQITSLPYSHEQTDAIGATNNDGFLSICGDEALMNDGLWYTIVGDGNNIKFTVTPTEGFDIQLGIFSGICGGLECVGNADAGLEGYTETYTILNSVAGAKYYINVGAYNDEEDKPEGNFTIDVKNVVTPVNDSCTNPIAITTFPYFHEQTDAVEATNNEGIIEACGDNLMNDGVWYSVEGNGNNLVVTVDPEDNFDPQLGIYSGSCNDLICEGTADNGNQGGNETVIINNSVVGVTYYINIGHFADTDHPEGNFTIDVKSFAPLVNDSCASAIAIDSLPYSYTQTDGFLSTNNEGFIEVCSDGEMNDGLWYTVIGDGNYIKITVTPEPDSGNFNPKIGVYSGDCFNLECIGSADHNYYGEAETYLILNSVVGLAYYINIGGPESYDTAEGNFTINVQSQVGPAAVPDCVSGVIYPADQSVDIPTGSVTFSWEAPTTGTVVDSYDVYRSTSSTIMPYNLVGNFTTNSATVSINGYNTIIYWKVIAKNLAGDAIACSTWSFTTVAPPPAPANDACSTATVITTFPFSDQLDAVSATNNDGSVTACGVTTNDGIWYKVTGNGSDIAISATTVGWDGRLSVYTGSCGEFTCYGTKDSAGTNGTELVVITDSELGTVYYMNIGYWGADDAAEGLTFVSVVTSALGIGGNEVKNFTAYPNPVKDVLNLSSGQNISNVAVFNLLGQQVITKSINASQSQLDMSALSAGTYLVKVTADDAVKTIKVVKQ